MKATRVRLPNINFMARANNMNELNRTHFQISRSAEYFDARELQAQTGQPMSKFGEVVLKELIDNALDACESAGIDPVIHIGVAIVGIKMQICVSDNGSGISEKVFTGSCGIAGTTRAEFRASARRYSQGITTRQHERTTVRC